MPSSLYSMKNHEKSKKHREMVTLLRQQLKEEDSSLGLDLDGMDGEEVDDEQQDEEEEVEDRPRQKYDAVCGKWCTSCHNDKDVMAQTVCNLMLLCLDIFLIQTVQKAKEKKETTESSTCEYKY